MEDKIFRFKGIDFKKVGDNIEVSMNDYANSSETINIKNGKLDETSKREDMV